MSFLWGEPRRKPSFSSVFINFSCSVPRRQEVKRMCLSSVFFPLSFSPTSHLLVFQEGMISDFDSNLLALANTSSQCLPPSALLSRLSLFFFCLSLYCRWKAAETTWLSC